MYRRLTQGERYQIEVLIKSGYTHRRIAKVLSVNQSTVSREILKVSKIYSARLAEKETGLRRLARYEKRRLIGGKLEALIRENILQDWSPEQIKRRLGGGNIIIPSIQTIYRYLDRKKKEKDPLWYHLRILRKERNDRKRPGWRPNKKHGFARTSIEVRPKIVEERSRLGDFERDTVFGKKTGPLLLSIVDRTSRKLYLKLISKKSRKLVERATIRTLGNLKVHTITNDNGCEFWQPSKTEKRLSTTIYFTHPYSSWERGTNENTNGLIRQYFPKETAIKMSDIAKVKHVEELLNNRPRKCLGFKTPHEVDKELRRVMR